MKIIKRQYLDQLISVMGTPDIKVITGVRRSGKSVLLQTFEEYIAKNISNANIIHIDYNEYRFKDLQESDSLYQYVDNLYDKKAHNFLLIDEIEMCKNFETAINYLHNDMKYDIYITGSNAFLLSSDLATLFTGRTYEIEIYPFSFSEYLTYYGLNPQSANTPSESYSSSPSSASYNQSSPRFSDQYTALDNYLLEGGFAGSYIYDELSEKYRYLSDIYDTLIIRDIEQKHRLQNGATLRKIGDVLMDNLGNLTTGRNIANTLTSSHQPTNNKTVGSYLDYLTEAFAFYKVKRYDVRGKTYLYSQDKYYLCDHSLRYAKLGTKDMDYGGIYENIVALELLRRGYEIYVGTLEGKEIDFVAKRRDEQIYIQVSYDITNPSTLDREVAPLLSVRDAYPKYIVARTRQPLWQLEGIKIIDLADWLLSNPKNML